MPAIRFLSEGDAGRFLGFPRGTLKRMRCLGLGPPYILAEDPERGLVFSYVEEDLQAWALARKTTARDGVGKLWEKREDVLSQGNARAPGNVSSTIRG